MSVEKNNSLTDKNIELGKALFKNKTNFVLGVAELTQLPLTDLPEIAFAGRSNVGKSSIIKFLYFTLCFFKASKIAGVLPFSYPQSNVR